MKKREREKEYKKDNNRNECEYHQQPSTKEKLGFVNWVSEL